MLYIVHTSARAHDEREGREGGGGGKEEEGRERNCIKSKIFR